mmetsp:Transcript_27132/g.68556  ORF Transcript_27132/g.68556 Transcript_27132/m.68556 type:complete len:86 (-) Transcript_27132:177-434(-)
MLLDRRLEELEELRPGPEEDHLLLGVVHHRAHDAQCHQAEASSSTSESIQLCSSSGASAGMAGLRLVSVIAGWDAMPTCTPERKR